MKEIILSLNSNEFNNNIGKQVAKLVAKTESRVQRVKAANDLLESDTGSVRLVLERDYRSLATYLISNGVLIPTGPRHIGSCRAITEVLWGTYSADRDLVEQATTFSVGDPSIDSDPEDILRPTQEDREVIWYPDATFPDQWHRIFTVSRPRLDVTTAIFGNTVYADDDDLMLHMMELSSARELTAEEIATSRAAVPQRPCIVRAVTPEHMASPEYATVLRGSILAADAVLRHGEVTLQVTEERLFEKA